MIKANELRKGNLVYTDKNDSVKTIVEIRHTCVSLKYIRSDTGTPHQSMVDYDRLIPIPLTKEGFVKFGFERFGINFRFNNFEYNPVTKNMIVHAGGSYYNGFVLRVDYVHQLQNLYFTLTGEELTVKL